MQEEKKIKTAFISVFNKDNLDKLIKHLNSLNIELISTGGTEKYIRNLGIKVRSVQDLTNFPSILGGRVKTLHPKIFGGILNRRSKNADQKEILQFDIPNIDMVIVDLYPFQKTIQDENSTEQDIIEKIDIGGISLIRAAAKNYKDVLVVPSKDLYELALEKTKKGKTDINTRKYFAKKAFNLSSSYDSVIYNWFDESNKTSEKINISFSKLKKLRYGENPHQSGSFYGDLNTVFTQLNGKDLSYNNLLDIDAAINLILDFESTTFCILKHNNPCGVASKKALLDCWNEALAGDPISAFGGVLITNDIIDIKTAKKINELFFEIIIAPEYETEAFKILKTKKNRIILKLNDINNISKLTFRSILNGLLSQERDVIIDSKKNLDKITNIKPTKKQESDLLFANTICKHTKSNAIVLVKDKQLIGIGCGQTSRIDALKQAINKAKSFGFNLDGAVMASDAFFPFPDCVEIAFKEGINAVIQPGGSINDKLSINYCNENNMAMVLTNIRHFKH